MRFIAVSIFAVTAMFMVGCYHQEESSPRAEKSMQIISQSFRAHQEMDQKFGAEHGNVSPSLAWSPTPIGTKTMALIVEDPDAPKSTPFVHWVIFNIDPKDQIEEGKVPNGSTQGINDAGQDGYHGPKPPSGTHHYHFRVYALNTRLNLAPGSTKDQVMRALKDHILADGEIVGLYTHR